MTHPSDEQWMAYLYRETDETSPAALDEHLRSCRDCRAQVDAWRKAVAELDAWKLRRSPRRRSALRPVIKWAAAAAVLLGVGYGLGRLAAPGPREMGPSTAQLDQRLASLESSLDARLRQEVSEAVAAELSDTRADLEEQLGEMLAAFAEREELARWEDRQMLAELVRRLESRRIADRVALERDLKALAVLAGNEFLRTEQAVNELVSYGPPVQAASQLEGGPGTTGP